MSKPRNNAAAGPPDPTPDDHDSDRTRTAYHEAGHAVMALLLGRNVHRVSIIPKRTRLGNCELRKDVARIARDSLEADVLVLLAGMVAESFLTGHYDPRSADSDLRNVERLARMRTDGASSERQIRRWLEKTEHLLQTPPHREVIQILATQLLDRDKISGRQAHHHFREVMDRFQKHGR